MTWLAVALNVLAVALLIGLFVLHVKEYGRRKSDDEEGE